MAAWNLFELGEAFGTGDKLMLNCRAQESGETSFNKLPLNESADSKKKTPDSRPAFKFTVLVAALNRY